ncbi:MAG: hypothetical protein Q8S73_04975 [Deltaproteobacteria bacterium]|nr:hypothetical protein [Myxococcales bacterium]MDP3213432.1 hypothetical protein [Deltaproteobacteria bacterium]
MNARRPRTAVRSSALPSLAALLASGVVLDGCDASTDASARQQRLSSHGENAARDLQGSRLGDALKEIGIGLGLIDATSPGVSTAGAPPVVNPQPDMQPSGAIAPVQPTPPSPPPPAIHTEGGPMRADPAPPPPPPEPVLAPPGGMPMVHPAPPARR